MCTVRVKKQRESNMHSQWDPSIFPQLLSRAPTMEDHARLGYPIPPKGVVGLGVEINEEYLIAGLGSHEPAEFVGLARKRDGSLTNQ